MPARKALVGRAARWLHLDRAVFFSILSKTWSSTAGIVTTLLIAVFFSPELQGFHYTFAAVVALQVFGELGLGTVLTYYASHEWAKLSLNQLGRPIGDEHAMSRLSSLGQFAIKWYAAAAAFVVTGVAAGGWIFFSAAGEVHVSWQGPWFALCAVTGITLCMTPVWALLEGCNQVSNTYAYRLIQAVALSATAWIAITLGAGLWTSSLSALVGLLFAATLMNRRYGPLLRAVFLTQPTVSRLSWRRDILPMQWRFALSWISGYLMFSLFTPVLFHYHGAVIAGQMGMTWALVSIITTLTYSWIMPRAPTFGILIASEKYAELDRLFFRIASVVIGITTLGAFVIWLLVYALSQFPNPFAARLLPPLPTALMLAASAINSATIPFAIYLRAHKREPLLVLSIVGAVISAAAFVVLGQTYAADGIAVAYLTTTAVLAPFVLLLWHRKRQEWHAPGTSSEAYFPRT